MQNLAPGLLRLPITHKAKARRVALLRSGRWDATSKTRHQYGHKHAALPFAEGEWTCPALHGDGSPRR